MIRCRGLTLIELLLALTVVALVAGLILWTANNFRSRQAVKNARTEIVSALNLARIRSVNGLDDQAHGVNFGLTEVTIFAGSVFAAGAPGNQVIDLPLVNLNPNLNGGDNVVFDRLTGATANAGTIGINSLNGNYAATITVTSVGLIVDQ